MNKVKFQGLRSVFPGSPIFTVITNELLTEKSDQQDLLVMKTPVIHATTKKVIVNEIKGIKLPGDRDGLIINGGSDGLTFSEGDSFAKNMGDIDTSNMNKAGEKTAWIENPEVAFDLAKVVNDGEITRLKASKALIENQIEALVAINEANENARAQFKN